MRVRKMLYRVIATDEQGVDVLYNDFVHGVLADDWEEWCRRILPGTTRREEVERRKLPRYRRVAA